jgi:pimeloyl-ACP methyl ester carboxylesterase
MPVDARSRTVRSGEVSIAVREHSPAGSGRPTVLLVHGYPDRQDTWAALVARLPLDRWHVVTYDVRGAGDSDAPPGRAGYRTDRLVDDLVAVLDAVLAPQARVHLVGHDWGSVQLWDAVAAEATDPRLRGRIGSFTSVSGPSLDHLALLSRRPQGRRLRLVRQLAHSWYVQAFQVPVLPDLLWRLGHRHIARAIATTERLPADHWGPGLGEDAAHGLELYRANLLPRIRSPRAFRTDVPVLVIHPTRDRFLTEVVLDDLDERCSDLHVERVDAGHWVTVTHPSLVADLVSAHVERARGGSTPVSS